MAIMNHVEARANHRATKQFFSETHNHKPVARPGLNTKDEMVYSTAHVEHVRNHGPKVESAVKTKPVNTWNVSKLAAFRSVGGKTPQTIIRVQRELWESIGRPARVDILGDLVSGITIKPGNQVASRYVSGKRGHVTFQVYTPKLKIDTIARSTVLVKASSRAGEIMLDLPHPLWIAGDPAFESTHKALPAEKAKEVHLPAINGTTKINGKTNGNGKHLTPLPIAQAHIGTAPVAKQGPADNPVPTKVELLKAELKHRLDAVKHAKEALEQATGLKLKITRDLHFIIDL